MIEITLDASNLEIFEPCPRKYYYSHELNLIPNRARTAFDIGSYYHDVLAHYYSLPHSERLQAAFAYSKQAELFSKYNILDIEEQNFHRKRLAEYFNRWDSEDSQMEVIAVEQGFSYILYEDVFVRYILEGKIDLINKCPPYGLNVMDHKTQSRQDDRWPFNHQVCNYLNFMRRQGIPANYFVYNYIGLQAKLPSDGIRRQIYTPHPGMLDQWENEVCRTFDILAEIKQCGGNIEDFERRRSACANSKYGLCVYHKMCSVPDGSGWNVRSAYKENEKRWKAWD